MLTPADARSIVEQIAADDARGAEALSHELRGIRFFLARHVPPCEIDDQVQEVFLIVVRAIRRGVLRDPERLMGFVRTVATRQAAECINRVSRLRTREIPVADYDAAFEVKDQGKNPEEYALERDRMREAAGVIAALPARTREILERFYIAEETMPDICRTMSLTRTQFRLLKSRALGHLGEIRKANANRGRLSQLKGRHLAQAA
jgi:RNA polymerase sigma-70 factor (ECF subfamily)